MPNYKDMLEGWGFQRIQRRGNELIADCAICGGRRKFYFNTRKQMAICFRGCFAGSAVTLTSIFERCDADEARAKLEAGVGWFARFQAIMKKDERDNPRRTPFVMPVLRALNSSEEEYLLRRRIPLSVAVSNGGRGCDDLHGLVAAFRDCSRSEAEELVRTFSGRFDYLLNRIIWPVFSNGNLLGAEARACGKQSPKVCYPTGINLKETIHFSKKLDEPWVILVEGMLDKFTVESWGYQVGATFSSGVSRGQSALLHRFERVYCAYDADKGGEKGLESVIRRLFDGCLIFEVKLPKGKDPNDCSMEEFAKAFIDAKLVTETHPIRIKVLKEKRKSYARR